ncbi:MAG: TlpA family protein disulfide reductase [Inhella sp.]|jgi:peroxiredoxin
MTQRRLFVLSALALAAGGGGALVWQLNELPKAPAVDYVLLDGKKSSSAQWAGKVMLVNFWATSCVTCVKKMPMLMDTHRKYQPKGFEVLAVAMQYDPPDYVAQFAQTRQLPFGVVIDNQGAVSNAFGGVRVTPTSILIDRKGHIVARLVGDIEEAKLHALVEELLA